MGEVYRGWDERLERPVAVKVLHGDKRLTPSLRGRVMREAKLLSRLDHPNICRIYDVIERDDADYLVLELVEGHDLRVARTPRACAARVADRSERAAHRHPRAKLELAMCRNSAGEKAEADALAGQVIDTARRKHDDALLADALVRRVSWWIERADYARAERDASEGWSTAMRQLALTRELGNRDDEVYALTNLGAIVYAAGREEEALKLTGDARRLAAATGNRRLEVQTSINLAEAELKPGELAKGRAEAVKLIDRAVPIVPAEAARMRAIATSPAPRR